MNTSKTKNRWSRLQVGVVLLAAAGACLGAFYGGYYYRQALQAEEAAAIMDSIRLEQEKQCAYHKRYTTDAEAFPNLIPVRTHRNFTYVFNPTGMEVHRKGRRGYVLKMPSYEDGRICCEDPAQCKKLHYPSCSDLKARADYMSGEDCAAVRKRPLCKGPAVRPCGCQGKGLQTRVCDLETNAWSAWSMCSVAEACDCTAVSGIAPDSQTQVCNGCGVQTREYVCDRKTGQWIASDWSSCSREAQECAPTNW